jgi:hypothetical protein
VGDHERSGRKRVHGVIPDVGTIKYEEVYLKEYRSVAELEAALTSWFRFGVVARRVSAALWTLVH